MRKLYKSSIVAFLIFLMLTLSSCTEIFDNLFGDNAEAISNEREFFDDLCEEIFDDIVTSDTISLHFTIANPEDYGITDYPITLGTLSEESIEEDYEKIDFWFSQLNGIEYKYLTQDEQFTYKILYEYLETEIEYKDLYLYYEPLSCVYGDHLNIPIVFAEYAFYDRQDIEDYLLLLEDIENYCSEIISFEKRKSDAGLFMSDESADKVIKQCEDFIASPENNYMIDLFDERIDRFEGLTQNEKTEYKNLNKSLVQNNVTNAYNILINGLKELKGTGVNSAGICNFEDGKEYFEYLMQSDVGTSRSVEEIKTLIDNKMNADLTKIQSLSFNDPLLFDKMDSTTLETSDYKGTLDMLSEEMLVDFPAGPDINYTVKKVHSSMEDSLSPAFYMIPTIDNYEKNVIYVNGETDIQTLAHEGYPGHMYQNTFFASTNPSKIRLLFDVTGYSEGWATYVEIYSYELAGLDEDLAVAMEANLSYTLGIYSLIDIGINYEGWSKEYTDNYLDSLGITSKEAKKEIFEIMVGSPGNYLNYYFGYLEILELKNLARKEAGNNFTNLEFNTFLLETGPASFDLLEEQLYIWYK